MADWELLEKLNELREKGILTDDEFQVEKQKLLTPGGKSSRRPRGAVTFAIAAVAIVAVVAVMFFASKGNVERAVVVTSSSATDGPLEVGRTAPPVAANLAASPESSYQWAVSPLTIGLNPAFIERKLGTAKQKTASSWSFEVGRCEIVYWLKGSEIKSLSTDVTSERQPIVQGIRISPQTHFSSLIGGPVKLFSSCIYSCGNAADPTIDLYSRGSHSNNFVEVYYRGRYGAVTRKAMEGWAQAIRRQHGVSDDDYDNLDFEWFNCISDAPADVVTMMKREVVTGVQIGRDLTEHCSS